MKIAIMQPYFFPYLGYYQLAYAVDKFVFFDDVNFINKGWINRNNILVNKSSTLFTIPLIKSSQNSLINEILITPDSKWKIKFFKTLEMAYGKAKYYKDTIDIINNVFENSKGNLAELTKSSIREVFNYLGLDKNWVDSSSAYLNRDLKGQSRIIDICKKENADSYINLIGGKSLYDSKSFEQENIKIHFITNSFTPYKQFSEEFTPGLSMIDLLMHLSPEDLIKMFRNYNLS